MSGYPKNKANEFIGIIIVASAFLLGLALVSYNALDPSLNVSSSNPTYSNYIGEIGSWCADFLFQALGLSALLLPIPLVLTGYRKIREHSIVCPVRKALGFFCFVLGVSTGLSLLVPTLPENLNFTPGGLVGILLTHWLLRYLNQPGSFVVVATLLILSLLLTTRLSLNTLFTWIGKHPWNPLLILKGSCTSWLKKRSDRNILKRLKNERKVLVAQPLPKKQFGDHLVETKAGKRETDDDLESQSPNQPKLLIQEKGFYPAPLDPHTGEEDSPTERSLPLSRPYQIPSLHFLQHTRVDGTTEEAELIERAHRVAAKCAEFGVHGRVLQIHPGPVVTTFEFKPDPGVKYSKIPNLADDLCLALKAESVRIDRIPGKNTVGIEVPNPYRQTIFLRDIFSSTTFEQSSSLLTLGLGKLINGRTYVADLASMPHLLIAGATGSGKSVALNCIVCSILYKSSPQDVRFIMIDPKRLELGVYKEIPHLLTPIVTDPKKAANALNWAVREMENRYKILAEHGVRSIHQYNRLLGTAGEQSDQNEPKSLPYIVLIVDELADLMMTVGREVEPSLQRLAQMARATGIHLILATQRPSVDVLTGVIKSNFPCRISFRVSSKTDSRTVLDSNGAEQLLGQGDMLFLSQRSSRLVRIHGGYITEKEIKNITDFLKQQSTPHYKEEVLEGGEEEGGGVDVAELEDDLYEEAARLVVEARKASTSLLQRHLRIGYGRAARMLDVMENERIVGPPKGSKPREVLVPSNYFTETENT